MDSTADDHEERKSLTRPSNLLSPSGHRSKPRHINMCMDFGSRAAEQMNSPNIAFNDGDSPKNRGGNILGDYVLQTKLGAGAFGTVFKARSSKDNNTYVIKKIKQEYNGAG